MNSSHRHTTSPWFAKTYHFLVFLVFSTFFLNQAAASTQLTLYISSQQAKVMSEPAFNASLVTTLRLGDEVIQLRQQGAWFEITMTDGSSGWISRFLARDTPPSERVTVLPSDGNVELRDVRRRTSALTTAAAARGLAGSADAGDGLQADTEALRYMEGFSVSPDSIKMFMQPIITGAQ